MANFDYKSNVAQTLKSIGKAEQILRQITSQALRQTAQQVKREGARDLRHTRYSALGVREYLDYIDTERDFRVGKMIPIGDQYVTVSFSGKGLPITAFRPKSVEVQTAAGPRWAVDVTVYGRKKRTGAFHLKGGKKLRGGPLVHSSDFDSSSKAFKRKGPESLPIDRFLFISPGRLIEVHHLEDKLYDYGYAQLEKNILTQWQRKEGQIVRGQLR